MDAPLRLDDEENAKMRGALGSAIVTEKPNVKWDDVAGLGAAKDALKEAGRAPRLLVYVYDTV